MNMGAAVRSCFSKYVTFSGRALRSEYWWFTLFNMLISVVLSIVDATIFGSGDGQIAILSMIYSLAVFLPALSVAVRRLHDHGRTGWWFFIIFVPVVGIFVFLYWMIVKGSDEANDYGDVPGQGGSIDQDEYVDSNVPTVDRD